MLRSWAMMAFLVLPVTAGDLEGFLKNLSMQARADRNGFAAQLATQFKVSGVQVNAALAMTNEPADAFMIFQLGQLSGQSPERVMQVYKSHGKKGWGSMAKELGIKPGSPQFHALKRGDFHFGEGRKAGPGEDHPGKGHGKGRKHA